MEFVHMYASALESTQFSSFDFVYISLCYNLTDNMLNIKYN